VKTICHSDRELKVDKTARQHNFATHAKEFWAIQQAT